MNNITRQIQSWMDNDEGFYNSLLEMVQAATDEHDLACAMENYWDDLKDERVSNQHLIDLFDELMKCGKYTDIDWDELAEEYWAEYKKEDE